MGFCRKSFSLEGERVAGVLLVPGGKEIQLLGPPLNPETATVINPESEPLSLLITASAVRALGPEEATLPRMPAVNRAERLDCGGFSTAFQPRKILWNSVSL